MVIESISGNPINSALPAKPVAKDTADVKQKTSAPVSTDTINFTDAAQDIKTAVATGTTAPVINEDRVAAIRTALQSNGYKIDADRVAKKMLQFEDKLPDST